MKGVNGPKSQKGRGPLASAGELVGLQLGVQYREEEKWPRVGKVGRGANHGNQQVHLLKSFKIKGGQKD